MVDCNYCGLMVDEEEAVRYNGQNYHKNCIQEKKDRDELYDYITKIFGLISPGPVNINMIKRYRTFSGYTYKGMLYSLKYYYEILDGSIARAEERVGIIPYVYADAKAYYSNLYFRAGKTWNEAKKMKEREKISKRVMESKKNKRRKRRKIGSEKLYNLS